MGALKHEELDTADQTRLGPLLEIMGLHQDVEELESSSSFRRWSFSPASDRTKSLGSSFLPTSPSSTLLKPLHGATHRGGGGDGRSCPFLAACCCNAHGPEEDFKNAP